MLEARDIPMALHWERVREHFYRRLGNTARAEDCCAVAERLERRLFDESA